MARITKDVLYPGNYRLADGRRVRYSHDDVQHLAQRLREMVREGLNVPAAWEHQDGAKPRTAAEIQADKARLTLGYVADALVSPEGFLEVPLEIPNEADVKKLPAIRFVSPEIVEDFTDGSGRLWPGKSITHIAVTPRPVQHRQRPFGSGKQQLSIVRLSLGDYEMADNGDKGKPDVDTNGSQPSLKEILEELGSFDPPVVLPDDTDETNFMERLAVALKAIKGARGPLEPEPPEEPTEVNTPSVALSLEQQRTAKAHQKLLTTERTRLEERIKALFPSKINKPLRDKLLNELKTVRLSLDDECVLKPHKLLYQLEAYESVEPRQDWGGPDRLSLDGAITEVEMPAADRGGAPQSQAEIAQAVVDFEALLPGYRPQHTKQ